MPQLSLTNLDGVPWTMDLRITCDARHPELGTVVIVTLRNRHDELISQSRKTFRSIGCDYIASAVQAATEGYLYGDSWQAAHRALAHAAADAAAHEQLFKTEP